MTMVRPDNGPSVNGRTCDAYDGATGEPGGTPSR